MNHDSIKAIPLDRILFEETVDRALREDLGGSGDITTDAIIPAGDKAKARIVARAGGRLAGVDIAAYAFQRLDPHIRIEILRGDGTDVRAGETIAVVEGTARAILTGERTALNFLSHLSGIASTTREIVKAVASYPVHVVCTRKTLPGLRALQKFAVRAGGGFNHRFGLDDAVLIKDNHIALAGGIPEAIRRIRARAGHMVKIEVEVDTLAQLEKALEEKIDAVLLDNMTSTTLSEAVRMTAKRAITEASGGITPETAESVAATGVDLLSIGWLTHSSPALDMSLDIASEG